MTVEEMESVLETLGIKAIGSRGVEIQAECPGHEERTGHKDRNPSWYINADSGAHICFSCGFKGNIYSLTSYLNGAPIDFEVNEEEASIKLSGRLFKLLHPEEIKKEQDSHPITESMLSAFITPPDEALISRGLSKVAAESYELLWDRLRGNWIIPVRNPKGALLGWQEKGYRVRYFNNYPKGMKKGKSLFGYKQYASGDMVVVESPLDVIRLASVGITGAVATYGCSITGDQLELIRGADRVIFALDNDDAGKAASHDMLTRCLSLNTEAWFFNYDGLDVKDVGAMSRDEIVFGLANARHMTRGVRAI